MASNGDDNGVAAVPTPTPTPTPSPSPSQLSLSSSSSSSSSSSAAAAAAAPSSAFVPKRGLREVFTLPERREHLKCRDQVDAYVWCIKPQNHVRALYRYGAAADCAELWSNLKACMWIKLRSPSSWQQHLDEHRRDVLAARATNTTWERRIEVAPLGERAKRAFDEQRRAAAATAAAAEASAATTEAHARAAAGVVVVDAATASGE